MKPLLRLHDENLAYKLIENQDRIVTPSGKAFYRLREDNLVSFLQEGNPLLYIIDPTAVQLLKDATLTRTVHKGFELWRDDSLIFCWYPQGMHGTRAHYIDRDTFSYLFPHIN